MEDFRLTEVPGEGHMLLVRDALVGKHQDQMLHPGIADRLHGRIVQRLAHVDASDFRTEGGVTSCDGDGHDSRRW